MDEKKEETAPSDSGLFSEMDGFGDEAGGGRKSDLQPHNVVRTTKNVVPQKCKISVALESAAQKLFDGELGIDRQIRD